MVLQSSSVFDYLVFVVLIGAPLGVTLYSKFAGTEKKKETKADYVFAKVSLTAMMLSFAKGDVRSFLGYPSELYYHGVGMYETLYGKLLAYIIVAYLFVPVYFNLGATSIYKFLDLRFKSKTIVYLASGTFLVRKMLSLGTIIFTPCVALKTIIGLPYWASISGITAISVACSAVGGLTAGIMADVIQGLIMSGCTVAIIVKGVWDIGEVSHIYNVNHDRGRFDNFFNFDLDPTVRVATISAVFGQLFMSLSEFGCQQTFVQKCCSMNSVKEIRKTLWYNIPVQTILGSLFWISGMVIFAEYLNCDPLSANFIQKVDEIVPFYIEDKFIFIPGFLGIFVAILFNGALSSVVSNLTSMSTVAWEDYFSKLPCFATASDKQQLLGIRVLNVFIGALTMGIAYGITVGMSNITEVSKLMASVTAGPLLGVFLLAMLFPGCNWKGAVSGMVASYALVIWLVIGRTSIDGPKIPKLSLSMEGCSNQSFTNYEFPHQPEGGPWAIDELINKTSLIDLTPHLLLQPKKLDTLTQLYSITYMYYPLLGCGLCVITGLLVSYIFGTSEEDLYEETLIHPAVLRLSRCLPGKPRKFLQKNTCDTNANTTDISVSKVEGISHKRHGDMSDLLFVGSYSTNGKDL